MTIGICGLIALISSIFAIRDFKILFSKDKNGEIISDIMMNFFKKSNEKRLQAKNKIGKPSQNTQATVEQEEEFTDSRNIITNTKFRSTCQSTRTSIVIKTNEKSFHLTKNQNENFFILNI